MEIRFRFLGVNRVERSGWFKYYYSKGEGRVFIRVCVFGYGFREERIFGWFGFCYEIFLVVFIGYKIVV